MLPVATAKKINFRFLVQFNRKPNRSFRNIEYHPAEIDVCFSSHSTSIFMNSGCLRLDLIEDQQKPAEKLQLFYLALTTFVHLVG